MFQAMILVITMAHSPQLMKDNRGPYFTESECQARVTEMKRDMAGIMAHFGLVHIEGRCVDSDELGA